MKRALVLVAMAGAAGCSSLGPPVQGARTGDKIIRATKPMTQTAVAQIAWGDSSLASSVAALARLEPGETVPEGTVLVLPTRDRLAARLREASEFAAASAPGKARGPVASVGKRRTAARLFARGEEAMADDRADDALRNWEQAWSEDPACPGLADRLEEEYRIRGLEAFSQGELDRAVGLWERALAVDPRDETTLGYLRRAREQQSRSDEILKPGEAR
jgi:tetratricopeptide (TPR) repeat protein